MHTALLIVQYCNGHHVLCSIPLHVQSLWQFWSTMKKKKIILDFILIFCFSCFFTMAAIDDNRYLLYTKKLMEANMEKKLQFV